MSKRVTRRGGALIGMLFGCLTIGCTPFIQSSSAEFITPQFGRPEPLAQPPSTHNIKVNSNPPLMRTGFQVAGNDTKDDANAKSSNGDTNGNGEKKAEATPPAKTLLSWNFGGTGKDEPDETKEEPLAADRPDFVEASSNVGLGRIQLESGYTFIRDREGGTTTRRHSYPEINLRIGMIADWFELRIAQNFGEESSRSDETKLVSRGAEDLMLGVGLGLTEQSGCLPESRIVLQMRVPTGSSDFSAGKVLPGFNYLYGWEIIPDKLSFGASTQANRTVDGAGHFHTQWAQAGTFGIGLTKNLILYVESFGIFPSGAIDSDTGPEYYFDSGFVYRFSNNFQVDIRAGVGLNRRADDFFTGTGFAYRY